MLKRFALGTALDEFAKAVHFRRGERALEIQIQLHARQLEQMREQELGLQARRPDAFLREEFRALLDRFENGHARSLNGKHEDFQHRRCGIFVENMPK